MENNYLVTLYPFDWKPNDDFELKEMSADELIEFMGDNLDRAMNPTVSRKEITMFSVAKIGCCIADCSAQYNYTTTQAKG